MKNYIKQFCDYMKFVNYRRIVKHRIKKLKKCDLQKKNCKLFPTEIKKVLFIEASGCFGDGLYVSNLANLLHKKGIEVSFILPKKDLRIFGKLSAVKEFFDLENLDDRNKAIEYSPDITIDLEFAHNNNWNERVDLLTRINSYKITTADYLQNFNMFDEYISYEDVDHFGKAIAKIYKRLTRESSVDIIKPYVSITDYNKDNACKIIENSFGIKRPLIYLNAIGSADNRSFSKEQLNLLVNELSKLNVNVLYHGHYIGENDRFKEIPKCDFFDVCAIVSYSAAVITVDTSICHVASACNVPQLTFFRGNCLEYYKKRLMSEYWAPLSDISISAFENSDGFYITKYNRGSQNELPVSDISDDYLLKETNLFINKLNLD